MGRYAVRNCGVVSDRAIHVFQLASMDFRSPCSIDGAAVGGGSIICAICSLWLRPSGERVYSCSVAAKLQREFEII